MNLDGIVPEEVSLASKLSACENIKVLESGQQFHCLSVKLGLETNLFAGSSLIDMYSKCGDIEDTHKIYSSMPEQSVVSVNALIAGYALQNTKESINLLYEMQILGLKPSEITFASLIDVCKGSAKVILGMQIHCAIVKRAHIQNECSDVALSLYQEMHDNNILPDQATFVTVLRTCALLSSLHDDMYAKCGDIKSAVQVFEELATKKDVISWNSMIVGFAKNGYAKCALKVFDEMTQSCITPDDVTHSLDCLPLVAMQEYMGMKKGDRGQLRNLLS
ncbi:Pentatricopeptide repeat-containing protein, mitochondrial [Glycine soja]|nr:Pentatricopeptide repeat-containing protein, mitochondrial [Glycine soja]